MQRQVCWMFINFLALLQYLLVTTVLNACNDFAPFFIFGCNILS